MAHVTHEDLDQLLEKALLLDDHGALAKQLVGLAEAYESGDISRAAIFVLAAEEWRQAGQPARALELFQRALEDGGEAGTDPRAGIADTLFELDRPDEAREVISEIAAGERRDPSTMLYVAETLMAYGDLEAAHSWATEGVWLCGGDEDMREALLRTRYRIRVDLGLPEDDLDALLDTEPSKLSNRGGGALG
ncbi:tetratricopeptide repeat protein [Rhizohabitans arisaemae]|uniref:tetratricopeptide repeat protein n=1 Tax=Rhizohabitans arisaemae TaxID=2720610 RepID=UPI0024B06E7D|nr:tetratricopeptide repeat protein [Rhizohabitans arisaemae]